MKFKHIDIDLIATKNRMFGNIAYRHSSILGMSVIQIGDMRLIINSHSWLRRAENEV